MNEALEIVEEASFSRGEMLAYDKFCDGNRTFRRRDFRDLLTAPAKRAF